MADEGLNLDYRDPEWLADQLGVDKSTIYRYLQEGLLPGLQLGRKWLVSERQVIEFLDAEARRQTEVRRKGMAPKPDRFDKYTEKARRVLLLAQEEAVGFNHNYVGTEHILLGLLGVGDGLAAAAMAELALEPQAVRGAIVSLIGHGQARPTSGEIGLTPRARDSLSLAFEEAKRMNHAYIGTEHLLLGLLRQSEGVAAVILGRLGANLDDARQAVTRLLLRGP